MFVVEPVDLRPFGRDLAENQLCSAHFSLEGLVQNWSVRFGEALKSRGGYLPKLGRVLRSSQAYPGGCVFNRVQHVLSCLPDVALRNGAKSVPPELIGQQCYEGFRSGLVAF